MATDPLPMAREAAEHIARRKPGVKHLLGHLYLLAQIMQLGSGMTEERWLLMCQEFWRDVAARQGGQNVQSH